MMADNAKVSVIIPAYNRVDYIDQTIRCVLDQTYPNVELIVVDDGSEDGTYEKINTYGDRLQLLIHPGHANRGQSEAINIGMAKATGEYIAILDSDDYWELNKLEVQVAYLDKHPDIGLVYTNGYAVDAGGNQLYPIHASDHVETNEPDLVLLDCYIALPVNSLVRREVYERVGWFEARYRASQDHDMLIRIAEVAKLAYIPDFLWYYRQHGGSISSTQQDIRWRTGFTILENAKKRYPYKSVTIRKRLAVLNYRLGLCHFAGHKFIRAFGRMMVALMLDPVRSLKVAAGIEKRN